jgi:hypothetical protein
VGGGTITFGGGGMGSGTKGPVDIISACACPNIGINCSKLPISQLNLEKPFIPAPLSSLCLMIKRVEYIPLFLYRP